MRRAEREGDSWSGHWSLPGGRADECDVDPLETAIRELHEECGIRLSREQVSAALPAMLARRRTGPFLLVEPFVFDIESELPTIATASEVAGTMWVPQSRLADPGQHSLQRAPGLPPEMWFPAMTMPGVPLWGFTHRLLVDWLDVTPRDGDRPGFDIAEMMQVSGPIPTEAVIEQFSVPGAYVAKVNRVEIRPEYIRVWGLDFEEYVIEAVMD